MPDPLGKNFRVFPGFKKVTSPVGRIQYGILFPAKKAFLPEQ